jgi:energy-converting hydrogenase Eha subunit A
MSSAAVVPSVIVAEVVGLPVCPTAVPGVGDATAYLAQTK